MYDTEWYIQRKTNSIRKTLIFFMIVGHYKTFLEKWLYLLLFFVETNQITLDVIIIYVYNNVRASYKYTSLLQQVVRFAEFSMINVYVKNTLNNSFNYRVWSELFPILINNYLLLYWLNASCDFQFGQQSLWLSVGKSTAKTVSAHPCVLATYMFVFHL